MNKYYQEKILTQCHKMSDTNCWQWTGQISNSGYGRMMIKDGNGVTRTISAHELSYLGFIDQLSPGVLVKQTCGNRLCVNPQHLERFVPVDAKEEYLVRN